MIASEAMIRANKQTMKMSSACAEEFPMSVQLAGCEPRVMAEAAKMNVDRGAAIIDINMGCPVKKVVKGDAGSALMRDEILAGAIMEAVVKAVPVPVTLKMRTGWDERNRNAPNLAPHRRDRRHPAGHRPWPHPQSALYRPCRLELHPSGQGRRFDPGGGQWRRQFHRRRRRKCCANREPTA